MILGHVLEILVEQRRVEEGYDATIEGHNLCALVPYALHLAKDAVALDVVTHTQASRHEREPVDEVLENILHGETQTSGKTSRDERDATLGNLEEH